MKKAPRLLQSRGLVASAQPPEGATRTLNVSRVCPSVQLRLEEGSDRVALDAEADHLGAAVDLLDRLGRDEAPAAGKEAGTDGERIGRLGRAAVHRALDPADHAPSRIRHEVAGGAAQIDGQRTHADEPIPELREKSPRCRKEFVKQVIAPASRS